MAKRTARTGRRKKEPLNDKLKNEIKGIMIFGLACLGFLMVYADNDGAITQSVGQVFRTLMGSGSAVFFLFMGAAGFMIMGQNKKVLRTRMVGLTILWLVIEGFLQLGFLSRGIDGGIIGRMLTLILAKSVGVTGSYVVLTVVGTIATVLVLNRSIVESGKDMIKGTGNVIAFLGKQVKDFTVVLSDNESDRKEEKKREIKKGKQRLRQFIKTKKSIVLIRKNMLLWSRFLMHLSRRSGYRQRIARISFPSLKNRSPR